MFVCYKCAIAGATARTQCHCPKDSKVPDCEWDFWIGLLSDRKLFLHALLFRCECHCHCTRKIQCDRPLQRGADDVQCLLSHLCVVTYSLTSALLFLIF